jgi:hypothetical protein
MTHPAHSRQPSMDEIEAEERAEDAEVPEPPCDRCGEPIGWDGNSGCRDPRCPLWGEPP